MIDMAYYNAELNTIILIIMQNERSKIMGNISKLPAKWANIFVPLILSGLMSGIISLINMLRNLGWYQGFLNEWFQNWMISWSMAFPIVLFLLPWVRKLVGIFVDMPQINPPK